MQNCTVNAQKNFPASIERIYEAWTKPDHLKKWWQPGSFVLRESNTDIQKGGRIDYRFEATDGRKASLEGSYKNVVPNELLHFEWTWMEGGSGNNPPQEITITFEKEPQGGSVHVCQNSPAGSETHVAGLEHSWEEALEHLAVFLSETYAVS